MISTSFITGTGFMKCRPMKRSGRSVVEARRVIEIDEVLDAKSASALMCGASCLKISFLVASSSVAQGAAQMAAPAWVRSRALAIYQLGFNFAIGLGTLFWGWLGTRYGLQTTMLAAAATGLVLALLARRFNIDHEPAATLSGDTALPAPEAVDPDMAAVVPLARGQVMESQRYRIADADREPFLAVMAELRRVRGRAGAIDWQLYEDIAHHDAWLEVWTVENWSDHLREASRMAESDRAILARAMALNQGDPPPPSRFLAVTPRSITDDTG